MSTNFEAENFEDLVANESFQRWAMSIGSTDENRAWDEVYASNAQMRERMIQAKLAVLMLSRTESEVDSITVDKSWQKLNQQIDSPDRPSPMKQWLRMAAVFSVMVLSALWAFIQFWQSEDYVSYHADFGQKKEITLPDGSQVILNANSTLSTYENWNDQSREVWLESGEAFFKITKTEGKDRFVVHMDNAQVEVLGTQFNINRRTVAIEVLLIEGKIQLNTPKENRTLDPGQLAILDKSGSLEIRKVNVSKRDAWIRNSLVLDNKSLAKIGDIIEAQYGVSVHMSDNVKNRMVAGEIPNANLENLLKALEVTLNLNISKSGDAILITKQNP